MWKKALLVLSLFAFTIAITVPVNSADARPRSFSSGKKSFSNTPSKSQSGVSSNSTTNKSSASSAGTSTNRGLFGGGSFMKGMMIGGLAGMLFGGMFGSGVFGNMMGLLINVIALFVLFAVFRGIYDAIKRRRNPQHQDPNNR
jgi:predicted lipid-binding transport protein (Tim44 family)